MNFLFMKDCDVRLWHIENCDEIKQVIEQNKNLKNMKTANVSVFFLDYISKQILNLVFQMWKNIFG